MDFLKQAAERVIALFPLKNIIIFESLPDFADNTRAVFDELVRQGVNKTYQLVWTTHGDGTLPDDLKDVKNVKAVNMNSAAYKYCYSYFAKALIVGNFFMQRRRPEQYYLYAAHGAAFKAIKDRRYSVPKDCRGCDFCVLSEGLGEYDVRNLNVTPNDVHMLPLGYARNDRLLHPDENVRRLFTQEEGAKLIYWMPTFRQKSGSAHAYSSISIPFIHDREMAEQINEAAKAHNTLLIVKPHPAQDVEYIKNFRLSHIRLIDNAYLAAHGIDNYGLLGACDALLTDYSSVFYDYLLCDRPIGLCWEDFEEYNRNEGFTVDIDEALEGCERLYTADALCAFIADVAEGRDRLREARNANKQRVHKYTDGRSAERIAAHVIKKLAEK